MSKVTNSNVRYKKLVDSVFEADVHLVVGEVEEVRELLQKKLGVVGSPGDDTDGEFITTDSPDFIIWTRVYNGDPYWDGVLVHEITHAVFGILHHMGVIYGASSEEVYTHYAGSLMRQSKKFLNKSK